MTGTGFVFYFVLLFFPYRREVLNSLFSIFRNKICSLIGGKYHLIVLKNNIVQLSHMLTILQNDLKILWLCTTIWQSFITDRVLNLKGKWKLGPTKSDFQTLIVLICTFLYCLWKFSTFKNSVISADAESHSIFTSKPSSLFIFTMLFEVVVLASLFSSLLLCFS